MEGIIKVEELRIHCVLGAYAHERKVEQEVLVDIEMRINMSEPVQTDSIVDTVNYEAVSAVCRDLAQSRRYHLLETFAYEALNAILDAFPVEWAKVRVRKPGALPLASYATVELEKAR